MKLKKGVSVIGLQPEIIIAILVAQQIFIEYAAELTITSATDSQHSRNSLHYVGHAIDLRTRDLPNTRTNQIAREIRQNLTDEYDIIVEPTHIHIEFQPKKNRP